MHEHMPRIDQSSVLDILADRILLCSDDILQAHELDLIRAGEPVGIDPADLGRKLFEARCLLGEAVRELRLAGAPPDTGAGPLAAQDPTTESLLCATADTLGIPPGQGAVGDSAMPVFAAIMRAIGGRRGAPESQREFAQLAAEWGIAKERRRIAREIHDRLGKDLARIRQCLELYELYLESDSARAAQNLAAAYAAADRVMLRINEVASGIYSGPVTEIKRALESCADYASAVKGASLDVTVSGEEESMPRMLCEQVILILDEAVHNAVAHSGAAHIRVWVDIGPASLRAEVSDDGSGFSHGSRDIVPGTGLTCMHERASMIRARFAIDTRPGAGTRVMLDVPYPQAYEPA